LLLAVSVLLPLPLLFLGLEWFDVSAQDNEAWNHFLKVLLPQVLSNSLYLSITSIVGTLSLGVSLAWVMARYRFKGHAFFSFALFLPLAIPAYVFAFASYSLGIQNAYVGVPLTFSLVFYPYVYLMSKQAFATQGERLAEVGQSLGLSNTQIFWKLRLALARPWIAAGALLVFMESLADFGTVSIYNFSTFTTAIYSSWFAMFSLPTAARISVLLLVIVSLIKYLESYSRRKQKQYNLAKNSNDALKTIQLKSGSALAIQLGLSSLVFISFILPVLALFQQLPAWNELQLLDYFKWNGYIFQTLLIAVLCTAVIFVIALAQVLGLRLFQIKNKAFKAIIWLSHLGYAIPGTVLAVAIYLSLSAIENTVLDLLEKLFGIQLPLLIMGSLAIVVLGLSMRFLSLGFGPIQSRSEQIRPQMEESARSLGASKFALIKEIFVPLLKPGFSVALLLVFIECTKELPVVLMTRPMGVETLSTRIFEWTAEGSWEQAALPSLFLIFVSLPTLYFVNRKGN
jgi:iron(III) transport system permease protein